MLLETLISEFNEKYCTPEIKKLTYHLPHVRILVAHHCEKEHREVFKIQIKQHDVLCWRDYSEQIVSSFDHQIQSE